MSRVKLSSVAQFIVADLGVILYSELGTLVLEGREVADFAKRIIPLLDGASNQEEIVNAFSHDLRANVQLLLQLLDRRGLLDRIDKQPSDPLQAHLKAQERFFRAWSDNPEKLTQRIRESRVLIVGLEPNGIVAASQLAASGIGALHIADDGQIAAADLPSASTRHSDVVDYSRRQALAELLATTSPWCRVTTSSRSDAEALFSQSPKARWDLLIGTTLPEDLAGQLKWARIAHDANLASLFGSFNGLESFIGPLVIPGKTACWNCSRLRMLANAEHSWAAHTLEQAFLARNGNTSVRATLVPMASLSGHLLSLEALKVLSGYAKSRLLGQLLIQNLVTLETSLHKVIPMPWCEICGGARAMKLTNDQPHEWSWAEDPEDLRQSLAGWLDSRTGVISHVVLRKLDTIKSRSLFCAQALPANYTEGVYHADKFENCGGKGLTECEAMIGAVGEAIERYSASRFRLADLLRSPLSGNGENFLDPRTLCLYEENQYGRKNFPFVRFDPSQPHLWTRGRWLDNGQTVWVPALMTFYNFPDEADDLFCQITSNGLAAGIGLQDASLRSVLELVERDAFMISWLCRRPGRRLIIDDSLDQAAREVVAQLEECGAQLELYLLDAGLNIPVVACLGLGDGRCWPGLTVTSAAHLSPRIAVRNAILEHGYSGLYLRHLLHHRKHAIPVAPEQLRSWNFLDHGLFYLPVERAAACDFLRSDVDEAASLRSLEEPTELSLDHCSKRLTLAGVRVAIVDVTAPDVAQSPFRVVRALGTNMQPIHCGYGLDRLANPRLRTLLRGEVNTDIHPLC